ncbi:MAG: isoprenyl transferase [Oscillospiraceae bacterium]|nr:isoprenyl transferase [Oscillospiraceae bacterium]
MQMFFTKHKNKNVDKKAFPEHIAIIMDGNGRWAKKRGLPRSAGHSMGAKNLENVVRYLKDTSVRYLTVYAFSTENWKRPKDEVDDLMALLERYLRDYDNLLGGEDVKLKVIGRKDGLSDTLIKLIDEVEEKSKDRKQLTINIALNYGGRQEICDAAKKIAEDVKMGKIDVSDIDEKLFNDYIYTKNIPDPDLIIRPSGEERLSNFLLWQCAYSEFWFSNVCWPDFTPDKLEEALLDFQKRNRRFGGV